MMKKAFYAYPGARTIIRTAIQQAMESTEKHGLKITPWESMNIVGFKLDQLIREQIQEADVLLADITYSNANVFYEIGYAAGVGKPIIPTVCTAVEKASSEINNIGLFDTTGWATYDNAEHLAAKLLSSDDVPWINMFGQRRNYSQPLYMIDPLKKTDFRNHIVHSIENSKVNSRRFDPTEIPRLTAAQAIADVSSSAGVILPLLSEEITGSFKHNLRIAFCLGVAHGYRIDALVIQNENSPAPVDYRDFIRNSNSRLETERHVEQFCASTLVLNQRPVRTDQKYRGILSEIELGSPAAENEVQQLSAYFLKTAEYNRALRAEGAVVIGRKGSGKSAVFLQVVEHEIESRQTCIVDLRPASHNLSEMREGLLSIANQGIFDHTIAAFWQYVIYSEILLKMREIVLPRSKNDYALQSRIRDLETEFKLDDAIVSGDFTSRLATAIDTVVNYVRDEPNPTRLRAQLTNMMFEDPLPRLRDTIASFRDHFDSIIVLIDDLDKGWPPRQVEDHDIGIVKHLIEVLNRIRRDLSRRRFAFRHLLFLRSDIYERLVEETSDRGKYNPIKVDWSDPEQLRHLLRMRVYSAINKVHREAAWAALDTPVNGQSAVDIMIKESLRRPRFLIDYCERALSFAINRGHTVVEASDLIEAGRQMSLYLVSDFGYELRDVAGTPEDIFYRFIGVPEVLSAEALEQILSDDFLSLGIPETIDLLLWYGFLGVRFEDGRSLFIYDRAYDFRRLDAERKSAGTSYVVNPAFLRGLDS